MNTRAQLARLSPGTNLHLGTGGIPELTREDILAALGYAQSYRIKESQLGVHLVLARYALDSVSRHALEQLVPRLSWNLWFKYRRSGLTSCKVMARLGQLAVQEWCDHESVRKSGMKGMAQFVGVDPRTWAKRYLSHYGYVLSELYKIEAPVLSAVMDALK